jgi:fibronectin type 3 domain-containing protein
LGLQVLPGWGSLQHDGVDATTYVDTDVTAGTTYYYVITAVMGTAQSPDLGETSATVPTP